MRESHGVCCTSVFFPLCYVKLSIIFTFSHYGDVVARGSIVFTKKIDLLILLDLHVLKVRIEKKAEVQHTP